MSFRLTINLPFMAILVSNLGFTRNAPSKSQVTQLIMAQQTEAIDLTRTDGESEGEKFSVPCGDPHHAILLKAMRKQLHDKQQEIAELENRIDTRDATIADRQARIADLQARDVTRVAEIRRLEAQVTALRDRLDRREKRHKRVSCLLAGH